MLRIVLIAITVFAAIGAGTVGAVFAGLQRLQEPVAERGDHHQHGAADRHHVYDSTGGLIHVFHNQGYRHIHVDLSAISPYFKEAIVAIEDHNFYTEGSWDLARLVELGVADVTHRGASLQGGSTITEQLAKISLYGGADPPQSIDYKIKEIVLGNEIALNFTKNEILDMYVNRIFYGNFARRRRQRGRDVLPQARERARPGAGRDARRPPAVAVGIQPTHSQLANDAVNPLAKNRQKAVLQAMQSSGYITQAQGVAAYAEKLTFHSWTESEPRADSTSTSSSYLEGYLNVHFPQYASPGGYNIHTTLDQAKQNSAYSTVHSRS